MSSIESWIASHPSVLGYKVFAVLLIAILVGRATGIWLYRKRKKLKNPDNFILGLNNLTYVLMSIWLFFIFLHVFGITIKEFFTSITIIAAALAIVFKDYILNGLNGMILMFGDSIQIGDYLKIGEHRGRIENITLMSVHMLSDDDDMIIIPNNVFVNSQIINFSRNPRHHSTIDFEIQSAQSINAVSLESMLHKVLNQEASLVRQDSAKLKVVEFRKDLVHYRFKFALKEYDPKVESSIKQSLWREILMVINMQKLQS
ncbi:MAG: mechanosensitive ion channel [Bacteroidetes bacterium]|nr:mechanosensitive ion channel [Bacteroidota bacterium]